MYMYVFAFRHICMYVYICVYVHVCRYTLIDLTRTYTQGNSKHEWIKKKIEEGDGLPDMMHTSDVDKAIKAAGFQVTSAQCRRRRHWDFGHCTSGTALPLSARSPTPLGLTKHLGFRH